MINYYLISFLISLVVVVITTPLIRYFAIKFKFVDAPSARKIHSAPIALGGGMSVFIGFLITVAVISLIFGMDIPKTARGLISGAFLIVIIGIYDDFYEMMPLTKLVGQAIAAFIFLAFVENPPAIMSIFAFFMIGMLWIVSMQNALNFLDNMDGLCSGISLIIASGFGILFILKEMPIFAILSFALAGAALGFLKYNLSPANIFLGDAGSLFFGFSLSCLGIAHLNTSKSLTAALAPMIMIAYPVFDLSFVTISRLSEGRKIYVGGKDHSSHKISFMGITRRATVFIIYLINILLIVFGLMTYYIGESPLRTLAIVLIASILAFTGAHLYKNILYMWKRLASILLDILAVNFSFIFYYMLKYEFSFKYLLTDLRTDAMMISLIWINIFWILFFSATGIYDLPAESKYRKYIIGYLKAYIVGAAIFLLANFNAAEGFLVSPLSVLIFIVILFSINSLLRYLFHIIMNKQYSAFSKKMNCVIVKLANYSEAPVNIEMLAKYYNIVGFVGKRVQSDLIYLGEVENLNDILKSNRVARIALDICPDFQENLTGIFDSTYYMESIFLVAGECHANLRGFRKNPAVFKNIFMVSLRGRRIYSRFIKRITEAAISIAALVIISPWIAIKFLLARREKLNIVKEMNIIVKNENVMNYKYLVDGQGRSAKFNPFGLMEIIRGNLSLVGTSISTESEYATAKRIYPGYWRKFIEKPGLIGPGYFGKSADQKLLIDLEYLEKSSVYHDFLILLKSVFGIALIKERSLENA